MGLFRRRPTVSNTSVLEEPIGVDAPEPNRSAVQAGVPGRCPECDGFGYIDNIDMVNRTQSQHCRDCGHVWAFSFDEDGDVLDLTDAALEADRESTTS